MVQHVVKQTYDHYLLVLDSNPEEGRIKRRFCFDKRWINKPEVEDMIKNVWEHECVGSPMFMVTSKIKRCRMALLQWNRDSEQFCHPYLGT